MALIRLSGDVELNPGYVNIEDIRNTRGLKISHLNVRSLRNKVDILRLELTNESSFDVLTLSETWLDASVSNSEVHMPGYSCMRKDRSNNKSGDGVIRLIYAKDYRIQFVMAGMSFTKLNVYA
jgi:exonuclease III